MRIALLEPFYAGSHKQWCDGLLKHSDRDITLYSLPGRHWKWRMHGAAVHFADKLNRESYEYDLIIVNSLMDVAVFKGLLKYDTAIHTYFHENQITYPWSETDQDVALNRDNHYGFINYTTALASDKLFFNSEYHKKSFLNALLEFLKQFPDKPSPSIVSLEKRSTVLHVGINPIEKQIKQNTSPRILWNHRWEHDKNPEDFFQLLYELKERGFNFELVVVGETYSKYPDEFDEAKEKLTSEIVHLGYVEDYQTYKKMVSSCDVLPVTSVQDFFGISVVEAISAGVVPIVPNRLAYPEYCEEDNVYRSKKELLQKIQNWSSLPLPDVRPFYWKNLIRQYSALFSVD